MECINFALETQKQDLGEGLEALVLEGSVSKEQSRSGVVLYSLSPELKNKGPVLELAKRKQRHRSHQARQTLVGQPIAPLAR
jgi:hypothetical protein